MKTIKLLSIVLFIVTLITSLIHAADVTGKWQGEFDSMVGKQVYIYTISTVNDTLTGTAQADIAGEKYESKLSNFKVTETEIRFTEHLDYQGMPLVITYVGKINGDEIQFTRTVGDFEPEKFTAKRVQSKDK